MDFNEGRKVSKYSNWLARERSIAHYTFNKISESARRSNVTRSKMTKSNIYYKKTDLDFRNPYPIYHATNVRFSGDPCRNLLNEKCAYYAQLSTKCRMVNFTKDFVKNTTTVCDIPKSIIKMIKSKDPDHYMLSEYNHYYAGGFLSKLELEDETYFIRPLVDNSLWITGINNPRKEFSLDTNGEPVFYSKVHQSKKHKHLCIRQKNNVSFNEIAIENGKLTVQPIWSNVSEVPFIDIKPFKVKTIGSLCVNYNFNLMDVNSKIPILEHTFSTQNDKKYNLGQFEFINKNSILFMGSKDVEYFDTRSKDSISLAVEATFPCDTNYNIQLCRRDKNYAFIASKHDIIKIDLREMKVIKKWSHFLMNHPVMMTYGFMEEEDYLCLSDGRENMFLLMDSVDNYLPFKVPSITDTYNEYFLKTRAAFGDVLDERLDMNIAGMEFIMKDNTIGIYYSNSVGDVFFNSSNKNADYNITMSNLNFGKWIDTLPNNTKKMKVTNLVDISDKREIMLTADEKGLNLERYTAENNLLNEFEELCDPLQYNMSEIWDDDQKDTTFLSQASEIVYNDLEYF